MGTSDSRPWRTLSPEPLLDKPLPPIPPSDCCVFSDVPTCSSLFSHSVPASLRINTMSCRDEGSYYWSPEDSEKTSSLCSGDSEDSLVEFVEAMLPPMPVLPPRLAPTKTVDHSRTDVPNDQTHTPNPSPVSKRSATPDQLNRLCSEIGQLSITRHDSAMFDTTPRMQLASVKTPSDYSERGVSPTYSDSGHSECSFGIEQSLSTFCRPPCRALLTENRNNSNQGQTSFMDWDEEVSRLTKMKKSIVDLKAAARSRSNSAPFTQTPSPSSTSDAPATRSSQLPSDERPLSAKLSRQFSRRSTAAPRPESLSHPERSARCRRVNMTSEEMKPTPHVDSFRTISPALTTKSSMSCSEDTSSHTVQRHGEKHNRRVGKFTHWIRVMRCS